MKDLDFYSFRPCPVKWGCLMLVILFTASFSFSQPNNNSCTNAIILSCNSTTSSNNLGALDDTVPTCGMVLPGQTVWYIVVGTGNNITASTCNPGTDFDSQIAIYTGSCNSLICVAGNNNDTSCGESDRDATVTWASIENEIYYVVVAGLFGADGNFELSIDCELPSGPPPPSGPNNNCSDAIEIYCYEDLIEGNNLDADNTSLPNCEPFSSGQVVWYRIRGIEGDITLSTCNPNTNFDTKIGVYTGTCNDLTCVVGNDNDASCGEDVLDATVTWTSTSLSQVYFIAIGGVAGAQGDFQLSITRSFSDCNIFCVSADNFSSCNDQGTFDPEDDTFTADVTVRFANLPATGDLELRGNDLVEDVSVPVSSIDPTATSYEFTGVELWADGQTLNISAIASALPLCRFFLNINAGDSRDQCSLTCTGEGPSVSLPDCWPDESTLSCEEPKGYAPDPNFPEHTPIKYIKVILHVFQEENPTNLGNYDVHPTDPGNYTSEHLGLFKSWFNNLGGVNDFVANLCDDPTDTSPHMKDTRIRFLNEGIENVDVFFHPDNQGWGTGFFKCNTFSSSTTYSLNIKELYVTGGTNGTSWAPFLPTSYTNFISLEENQNAFHVFMTRGTWIDVNNDGIPNEGDCTQFWPGAFMYEDDYQCNSSGGIQEAPVQFMYGNYEAYLRYTLGQAVYEAQGGRVRNELNSGGVVTLGHQILGEIHHVLSVDHISPLQGHFPYEDGNDGCDDTPLESIYNRMGCDYEGAYRCAFSQCQIGRMHRLMEELKPAFMRYPDGNGGFSMTPQLCEITEPDIVIPDGANLVWSSPRNLRSNVIIKSGGKLTINCDVGMPNKAWIIVEPGGRLIVDGAKIYNNCNNEYWNGIKVLGINQSQSPILSQGYLLLKDGSSLENASFPLAITEGGYVLAIGTDFKNCGTVRFDDYDFTNSSKFGNCNFIRTIDFEDFGSWPNQMELRSIKGIRVENCLFQTIASTGTTDNGIAIQGFDSRFEVINSTIEGFKVGVWGYTFFKNPFGRFTVKGCTLRDNRVGIASWANNNIVILDNIIEGIGNHADPGSHRGLTLNNCTGYVVKNNDFFGVNSSNSNLIGIWALNTGSEANLIKNNDFDDLYVANQAEQNNTGIFVDEGLQYHCNNNTTENSFDFLVFDQGIAQSQGSDQAGTKNTFSHFNASFGDFNNQSSGAINYFHTSVQEETPLPGYYFNIVPNLTDDGVECTDSGDDDIKLTTQEEQTLVEAYNNAKNARTDSLNVYNTLINGGESEATLVAEVMATTALQGPVLKQSILDISPFVSRGVLEALIQRDDIFSNTDLNQMLSANPDELRVPTLETFIYAELNKTLADSIISNQSQITARTTIEAKIAEYKMIMHQSSNRILKSELADTTGLDLTKYRLWLSNKESLEAEYEIVGTYIMEADYTGSRQIRDSIPNKFNLTGMALSEHAEYTNLTEIVINALENNTHHAALDSSTVSQVQTIADNSTGIAGVMAKGLLNVFYGYNYELTPKLPSGSSSLVAPQGNIVLHNSYQPLAIRPNPARNAVTFYYDLENGEIIGTLKVYNLNGQLVKEFTLEDQKGSVEWNTNQYEPGIYYCRTEQGTKTSPPLKLILIR